MQYIPVLILMLAGLIIGVAVVLLSHLLGPRRGNPIKDSPFECGVPPLGDARHRVSVRFYLVAILFLLFDVEAVFFIPWALVFKKYIAVNYFILFEMGVFLVFLLAGYYYVVRKGALEWE